MDAGALDQCRCQPRVRIPGLGIGLRIHVVGEQPREQADALVQRRRQRHAGRGLLRERPGQRSDLGAHLSADPGARQALRHPARAGLQSIRAHLERHRAGAASVRRARRRRQGLPTQARESVQGNAAPVGHGVRGVGVGRASQPHGALRGHRDRRRDRRDPGTECLERRVRGPDRVCRSEGTPDLVDLRPARVPGQKRDPRPARVTRARRCAVGEGRGHAGPLRGAPDRDRAGARAGD